MRLLLVPLPRGRPLHYPGTAALRISVKRVLAIGYPATVFTASETGAGEVASVQVHDLPPPSEPVA